MSRSGKLLILCIVAILAESLLRPQTSFAQTASPQASDARTACASDAQRLCAGVQPGGGRIVACLKEHKDSLSDQCKQAAGLPVNPSSSSAPSAPPIASSASETPASDGPAAAAPSPSAPAAAVIGAEADVVHAAIT